MAAYMVERRPVERAVEFIVAGCDDTQHPAVSRFTCHVSAIPGLGREVRPESWEASTEGQAPCGVEPAHGAGR